MKLIRLLPVFLLLSNISMSQISKEDHIECFLDGVLETQLLEKHIAGAALALVKDDEIVVTKGYGYSDYYQRIPVDPTQTMFRIGSVSKLFVWFAVMQMVEQGKIDLDADVNTYLKDFKIPEAFDGPITMRHIMSHTPGFEDKIIKLFSDDSLSVLPLSKLLPTQIPKRVRPAGVQASYSNHAVAIAAHIVELVSGMEWNDYVEQNIFNPLKMYTTTFRQPLPGYLKANMSKGYTYENEVITEKSFEYIPLAPAGAVSSTAADMAKFMQMLLNKGSLGDAKIVSDSTFESMLTPVLVHAPGTNPCLHGFMDMSNKGVHIFGHGGDTFWFHTLLAVIPEQDMGIFLSFNSMKGGEAYGEVANLLINKFFHHQDTLVPSISLSDEYLSKFAGEYKTNRYPHSDYLKLISLMGRMRVKAKEGKLQIASDSKVDYYVPTDSLSFRKEFDSESMIFQVDKKDDVEYAFLSNMSIFAFEKVPFRESRGLHLSILILVVLLSLVVLFHWPITFFVRFNYQALGSAPKPMPFGVKLSMWTTSFLLLFFYVGLSLSFAGGPEAVVYSVPATVKYLLVIPILLIPLNLVNLYNMVMLWPLISTRRRSKLFYTLTCIVHIAALWQLYFWNLLGWPY